MAKSVLLYVSYRIYNLIESIITERYINTHEIEKFSNI